MLQRRKKTQVPGEYFRNMRINSMLLEFIGVSCRYKTTDNKITITMSNSVSEEQLTFDIGKLGNSGQNVSSVMKPELYKAYKRIMQRTDLTYGYK